MSFDCALIDDVGRFDSGNKTKANDESKCEKIGSAGVRFPQEYSPTCIITPLSWFSKWQKHNETLSSASTTSVRASWLSI